MPVSSHAVANAFIGLAKAENKQLTNMQLQKLVLIAHGYCLAIFETPLYYNNTHAWQWGPVIPQLYKVLQKYGASNITKEISAEDKLSEKSDEFRIVKAVWVNYKHYTALQLSELTHQENTPWDITWKRKNFGIIDNRIIAAHYKTLVDT